MDPTLSLEARADAFAKAALGRRVSSDAWHAARTVALRALQTASKCVPLGEMEASMRAIFQRYDLKVVQRKQIEELRAAAQDYGILKDYSVDSLKLKRLKDALRDVCDSTISAWPHIDPDAVGAKSLDEI